MRYDIKVQLEITDAHALIEYTKTCAVDFGMRPEDIEDMTVREALRWLYDPGTAWPGGLITDCTIEYVAPEPATLPAPSATTLPVSSFTLPGFISWER